MEWRTIEYFDNFEVSDTGLIRNRHTLKQKAATRQRNGYVSVSLYQNGDRSTKYVHRIVMESFTTPLYGCESVHHVNGDRSDNRLCNLKWCTPSDNQNYRHGNSPEQYVPPKKVLKLIKESIKLGFFTKEEINEIYGTCINN